MYFSKEHNYNNYNSVRIPIYKDTPPSEVLQLVLIHMWNHYREYEKIEEYANSLIGNLKTDLKKGL